jgi:hypothetical protein
VYAGSSARSLEGCSTLLLTLALPRINEQMTTAKILAIYAAEGACLALNSKFLDLAIDLSVSVVHDCPPVSYYRIGLRDKAWLRKLLVAPGDYVEPGAVMAHFSTEPDEALDDAPSRAVRISIAGILNQSDWLD